MRFIKRYVSSLIVALYDLREEESGKNAPESSRLIYGVFLMILTAKNLNIWMKIPLRINRIGTVIENNLYR
jgi:hypothetical protein